MTDNPADAFTKLKHRLADEMRDLGLDIDHFVVMPADDVGGQHRAQCLFLISDSNEPKKKDDGFDEVINGAMAASPEEIADETRKDLEERLRNLKGDRGIGLDDEDGDED